MSSTTSTSPNSSPAADPPASSGTSPPSPPASPSPSNSSTTTTTTTATPSDASSPPPQASPPPASAAPPPKSSPPPSTPPPTSPPPSPPAAPPPSPPQSPPPASPPSPPASPPPSTPSSPPPASPPPSPPAAPPPAVSASPPDASPPPPSGGSPPPRASPTPPAKASPPPKSTSDSPPPPADVPPPSSNSPPPPQAKTPEKSPPSPTVTPPPSSSKSAPPPANNSPPEPTAQSPPPSVPSSPSPSLTSPPAPPSNSTPLPQKPTARSTPDANATANPKPGNKGGLNTGGAVTIGIVVGLLVLSLVVMAVWFAKKQKKRKAGANLGYGMPSPFASSQNSDSVFLKPQSPAPLVGSRSGSDFMYAQSDPGGVNNSKSWFTYEELVQATDGFSSKNLLGEGGFGCVYKGVLEDEREVAVKQLKIGGGQGEREFKAEVEIISRVHHRHLVSLVGYCISEHQRLLVYDYVPNDTLHFHLHAEGRPVMDWATRVKVAAGAARGIAYLHEDCHPRIIHRDIKSSNILLDSKFEAQVADFGLAKLTLDTNTHVTTRVMGTFGYMAPEYATSGKLTDKSDVYSYGVVLLELITGRKPVDCSQPLGDESLVEWARPLLCQALENGDFEGLADPRLEKNYIENEMFRMIEAASACVRHSAAKRPRMRQVVRAFDTLDDIADLSNGMKPGQSEIFDSAQQSAQIRMFQRMAFGSQDYSTSFFNQTQSSWKSKDFREQGDQTQSSWTSTDSGEHPRETQSSWTRDPRYQRDPQNQSTVISIDRSGQWNN